MRNLFYVDLHLEQINPKLNFREAITKVLSVNPKSQSRGNPLTNSKSHGKGNESHSMVDSLIV